MFEGKKILGIIPARGGSKGVPRKNLRIVQGKPLVARTVEICLASKYIDRLILSSEDQEIIETAEKFGCEVPFVRPAELAMDETSTNEVILHAIGAIDEEFDIIVCIQVTSPLLDAEDIDGVIRACAEKNASACVSVCEVEKSPYWMFNILENGYLCSLMGDGYLYKRRQELPRSYIPNGAVFASFKDKFLECMSFYTESTVGYIMPRARSLDVDTENDFNMLEFILNNRLDVGDGKNEC